MARISSSRMTRSLVRAPTMTVRWLPAFLRAWAMGCMGATPMPPPTQTARPKFSIWVGLPRGPSTASIESPGSRSASLWVLTPTVWKIRVMVPFTVSASAMVRGTRSPHSTSVWTMTNCPALRSRAMLAASISTRKTSSDRRVLDTILFIIPPWHWPAHSGGPEHRDFII